MTAETVRYSECPACGRSVHGASKLFTTTLFGQPTAILECAGCGLVFKEWFRSVDSVGTLYPEDYVHFARVTPGRAEVNSARQKLARCRRLLGAPASASLRVLDVGCGAGGFVFVARQLGYEAEGIDPYLPATLQSPHLRRAVPEDLAADTFDIVVLLNVAEHLPRPKPFFASLHRLLRPDGVLLVTSPFGSSLARRFHRQRWTHLALDEHVLFWTPSSLTAMLRPLGFRGETSIRVAGSPFPFGRTPAASSGTGGTPAIGESASRSGLQAAIWRLARRLQTHETLANVVRVLVDITRTGDYIEFAIATRHRHDPGKGLLRFERGWRGEASLWRQERRSR